MFSLFSPPILHPDLEYDVRLFLRSYADVHKCLEYSILSYPA